MELVLALAQAQVTNAFPFGVSALLLVVPRRTSCILRPLDLDNKSVRENIGRNQKNWRRCG